MRIILSIGFSVLLLVGCSPSKKIANGDYKMDDIYIGQSFEKVVRKLGTDFIKLDYEDVAQKYTDVGYDPNKQLVFYNGFDFVLEYGKWSNRTKHPIYLIYFKDDVAVYMVLSSYIYENTINQYRLDGLNIFSKKEAIIRVLGDNYYANNFDEETYDGEYQYFEKGISFISEEGVMRAVHLFPKMTVKQKNLFLKGNTIEIKRLEP